MGFHLLTFISHEATHVHRRAAFSFWTEPCHFSEIYISASYAKVFAILKCTDLRENLSPDVCPAKRKISIKAITIEACLFAWDILRSVQIHQMDSECELHRTIRMHILTWFIAVRTCQFFCACPALLNKIWICFWRIVKAVLHSSVSEKSTVSPLSISREICNFH